MSIFDYKQSTITVYRSGTISDPYISISEPKKVINQIILLSEIPAIENGVAISGLVEYKSVPENGLPVDGFYVDYTEGILSFHADQNGLTKTVIYKGRGNHFLSSSRIWLQNQGNEITETLDDRLSVIGSTTSSLQSQITSEQQARISADSTHANASTAHQATQITYDGSSSVKQKMDLQQIQINNIITSSGTSSTEVVDGRLGADGITRATLGTLVREMHGKQLVQSDQTATIKRGLNTINASHSTPTDFTIQGRTLINLLGRDGNFEVDSNGDGVADGWSASLWGATASIDSVNSKYGNKAQRITSNSGDTALARRVQKLNAVSILSGKYYVVLVDVVTDGTAKALLEVNGVTTFTTTNKALYVKIAPVSDINATIALHNQIALGSIGWVSFEGVRLYEISAADYAKIDVDPEYTGDKLAEKFPYVDSVQHLNTPVVRKRGKNLLPPVTQITMFSSSTLTVVSPYEFTMLTNSANINANFIVDVAPNTDYVFNMDCGADGQMAIYTMAVVSITAYGNTARVFNSGVNTQIKIYFRKTSAGTNVFKNLQLELGNVATEFEPQNDDYLYIPTTLASNIDGSVKDTYNSALGTVIRRLKTGVVLDGSLTWAFGVDFTGFKHVTTSLSALPLLINNSQVISKYDGKPLEHGGIIGWSKGDVGQVFGTGCGITISDAESGWGEAYIPSVAELQNYFNGWRMNNGTLGTQYESGTKKWTALDSPKANFGGKVSGSTVANPHISKNTAASTLTSPIAAWFAEETTAQYDNMSTLNGIITGHNNTTNGYIMQNLFSFNVIEHIIRKYGVSKFGAATTLADRVTWLKTNVERMVCNWWGFGSCPAGNKATLARWRSDNNSWYTASVASNTASSISKLSTEMAVGGALPPTNGIDSNGFVHFIVYTDASNGTISSQTSTDAVDLEVYLNLSTLPTGYATNEFTPYKLNYQLATALEDTIVAEGSIGLQSGGNQIELLEGVVIREKASPILYATDYYINIDSVKFPAIIGSELKFKTEIINAVYKNGSLDKKWIIETGGNAFGKHQARIKVADFDSNATYEVTYQVLDKQQITTNVIDATVRYQTNPKTVTDKLVQDVVDNETKISINTLQIINILARLKAAEI